VLIVRVPKSSFNTTLPRKSYIIRRDKSFEFSWNDPELARMLSRDVVHLDAGQRLVKRAGPPLKCVTAPIPAACVVVGTPFGNRIPNQGA
jgi:hypothetical protein